MSPAGESPFSFGNGAPFPKLAQLVQGLGNRGKIVYRKKIKSFW
jgi:hypothetical protein